MFYNQLCTVLGMMFKVFADNSFTAIWLFTEPFWPGKLDILRVLDSLSGQFRQISPSELRQMTCSRIRYSP